MVEVFEKDESDKKDKENIGHIFGQESEAEKNTCQNEVASQAFFKEEEVGKERLIKIITEATEQCGRTSIPILEESIPFKEAITEASKNGPTFLFDPSGTPWNTLTHPLPSSMHIFIGPEGGFTEEEITFAQESGTTIVSLGSNILRGETAVTIATYLAVETN
jgi:16S rRNA (uracil1498-N3)-methyltransferase